MSQLTAYDEMLEELDKRERRGELRGKCSFLLRLGRKTLGPPDAATEAALAAIQDADRLERMADAVLTAKTWEELLAAP